MIFNLILFFLMSANFSIASEYDPCFQGIGETISKDNKDLVGCEAARIALKSDPFGNQEYQKKIDLKLAKSVATQVKQIMQDFGASSSFYEENNKPFLIAKGTTVATSCRFDSMKELEKNGCNGKLSNVEKEKIKLLLDNLNFDSGYKANTLHESIAHIYGVNKYGHGLDSNFNQCPLKNSNFFTESQLTDDAISKIFQAFSTSESSSLDRSNIFGMYPQLALVFHAEKASPSFMKNFEKYMYNFQKSGKTQREYLQDFFFDSKNTEALAAGVSRRCEQVNSNLIKFVCNTPQEISPQDPKIAKILFDNYNIKKDYNEQKKDVKANPDSYKTYGYACELKAKNKGNPSLETKFEVVTLGDQNSCFSLKSESDTIDNWYNCFNQDVRTEKDPESEAQTIKLFCSRWSCNDEEAKKMTSCKNGGPLTSADLSLLKIDDKYISGQISYLEIIEKRQKAAKKYIAAIEKGEIVSEEIRNALGLSEFDLNAFGAEAVMKFAGLPSTPVILASVTQDMHDKGIKPSTPEEIREVITRATNLAPKVASNTSDDDFNMTPTVASTPTTVSYANNWRNNNYVKSETPVAKTKHKIVEAPSKRNPEVQQMMDDLQEIMKAGKGTSTPDDSDEEASTSFSGGSSASSNKKQAKTIQGLTSSDLETWAQKLKAKETTLNFRETLADQRDAEYWRNKALNEDEKKEKGRSIASVDEKESQGKGAAGSQSTLSSDSGKGKSKAELAAEVSASSTGLIVTPEKLDKLEKMDLKNRNFFGLLTSRPYLLRC